MIRSLFDDIEENPQTETETQPETTILHEEVVLPEEEVKVNLPETEELLEIPDYDYEIAEKPIVEQTAETITEIQPPTDIPILQDAEIIEEPMALPEIPATPNAKTIDELRIQSNIANTRDLTSEAKTTNELADVRAKPESIAETARNSGLAYAAAISLFASVAFLLIIGWFADLLLGTFPWGIVGGIILGSLIGFFQFFRMTSSIFKK